MFHDLLGIYDGHAARFVKRYADVREAMVDGRRRRTPRTCATRRYPEPEHGYTMAPDERERLKELLEGAEAPICLKNRNCASAVFHPRTLRGGTSSMKRFIRRPSPAMVVASIALFSSLGGVSYGVATGSIDGREIKNRSITNKDFKDGTLRGNEAKPNGFGGRRDQGVAPGTVPVAAGARELRGGQRRRPAVRGRGVTASQRTGQGRYAVTFNRDVRGCAYVATIGDEGTAGTGSGTVSVASNAVNPNSVNVRTARGNNDAQDRSFHLIVSC